MVKNLIQKKRVIVATEFEEFKDPLFNKKIIRHKMRRIQAKKHKIGTYEIEKISLSCFDDKRFVLDDGIHTLAYFYKDLKNRFSQTTMKEILTDKKRLKKIKKEILTDDHVSGIVKWAIRTILSLFMLTHKKNFTCIKTRHTLRSL